MAIGILDASYDGMARTHDSFKSMSFRVQRAAGPRRRRRRKGSGTTGSWFSPGGFRPRSDRAGLVSPPRTRLDCRGPKVTDHVIQGDGPHQLDEGTVGYGGLLP